MRKRGPEGQDSDDEPKTRRSSPGKRTRRDNGPQELLVEPIPPPTLKSLGTGHVYTYDVMQGGPRGVIAAQHEASRLSERFGEEVEAEWCLSTPWLCQLAVTHRARAQYALMWRPRFLAVVSLTRSLSLGCRAAHVNKGTVQLHRLQDTIFDKQIMVAQAHAVELLHDVTFRDAIEGTCEPIYWQGIMVGHVRKFDNRLRIEMLRAHMPETFKTPGSKVAINNNNGIQNFAMIDESARNGLVELRQDALKAIAAGREATMKALPASAVTEVP